MHQRRERVLESPNRVVSRSRKVYRIAAPVVLSICCAFAAASAQPTVEGRFELSRNETELFVTVQMKGSEAFDLGNSSLRFSFNSSALALSHPVPVGSRLDGADYAFHAYDGFFPPGTLYESHLTLSKANESSVNIVLLTLGEGQVVPTTWADVATLVLSITDDGSEQETELVWTLKEVFLDDNVTPVFEGVFMDDHTSLPDVPSQGADSRAPVSEIVGPDMLEVHMAGTLLASANDGGDDPSGIASAEWTDGDGWRQMIAADGEFDSALESLQADLPAYSSPAIREICVRATDLAGNVGEASCRIVPVWDPAGGFVTGGGWIDSPEGACAHAECTQESTGKASFGFVSKYQKGSNVPVGETRFRFKEGDLDFHADAFEWLVVDNTRAVFKGAGRINREGSFGFILSAVDADRTQFAEKVRLRMKIWDKADPDHVVYDTQRDEPDNSDAAVAIGGGSVQIHNAVDYGEASKVESEERLRPAAYVLKGNYPNPFNPTTKIVYAVPEKGEVAIAIYDVQGELIANLANGAHLAGSHQVEFDAGSRPSGIYFAVMTTPTGRLVEAMTLAR